MDCLHAGDGLPVGLYVHIPFCMGKCSYCGFYSESVAAHDPVRLYRALCAEMGRYGQVGFQTAYVGGGSPTSLPDSLLVELCGRIAANWPGIQEFTVECNPAEVCMGLLEGLRSAGVDRVSIGGQSFHQAELALLGRRHGPAQIRDAVRLARAAGLRNIGLDLIYAIPGSSLESWHRSLEQALALDVQHISTYSLTIEPGTPMAQALDAGCLRPVEEELDRDMYDLGVDVLAGAGYCHYEVSNFARPGFACRHNMGYWLNMPYVGIGPAAASYWQGRRTSNVADIESYVRAIESGLDPAVISEPVDPRAALWQTAVLNLRTRQGIDVRWFRQALGSDPLELFAGAICRYKALGLLEVTDRYVRLTADGMPVADSILGDFVLSG